jgi:formyl-CoA transferase
MRTTLPYCIRAARIGRNAPEETMRQETMRPYEGLFVLDTSQGIAGPYCATQLAALGATVVKVEPPAGDWSRGLSSRAGTHSVMHTAYNRGKRSIMLDLTLPADQTRLAALAAQADVILEAFRPGVAARLGITPQAGKPDVVFLSISGFGQTGPSSERPCTDSIAQAFTGMVALNQGMDGIPHRTGPFFAVDVVTGLSAMIAVQAALAEQQRDRLTNAPPQRRVLDVSLHQASAALLGYNIADWGWQGREPKSLNTPSGAYLAKDGHYVMFGLLREPDFVQLCQVLEIEDLSQDPRFATFPLRSEHREALLPLIRSAFLARPSTEWLPRFHAARMLCDQVNTPLDWLADPHVQETRAAVMLNQPGLGALPFPALPGLGPWSVAAPDLGEHTAELLQEFGL